MRLLTVRSSQGFEESISSHADSWHGGERRREETEKGERFRWRRGSSDKRTAKVF
jgi:hypothetical protein